MPDVIVRPDNPGTYITLVGESTVRPPASVAQTLALPIVHDWGPLGSEDGIQRVEAFGEFDSRFGNSDTAGRRAVLSSFVGPGVPGEPGAGGTLVYRMATGDAARSLIKLKNTKEAAEDALEIVAKYAGERGDRISIVTEADPLDAEKNRLRVLFDGVAQERYSYAKTNLAAVAASINARSTLVTAKVLVDGTALANGTKELAGGDNGDELTGAEWTAALDAFEFEDFSIFSPYDLTAEEVIASIYSWTLAQFEDQRPVMTVLGGDAEEDLTAALEAAATIRDPHVIRLAGGLFHDDFLDADVTTSQLAPRIAGILAGRGEESSLTFAPLAGLKQVGETSIGVDELATAAEGGLTVFRRTSRPEADLIVAKGVTTFTDDDDPTRPLELFSDPRIVRMHDLFLRRIKDWGDRNIVGPTRVTEPTKAAVRQRGQAEIDELLARQMILPGNKPDERPFFRVVDDPGENLKDAIVFEFGWLAARTTNFLIGQGKVR